MVRRENHPPLLQKLKKAFIQIHQAVRRTVRTIKGGKRWGRNWLRKSNDPIHEPPKPVMPAQVLLDKSQQFALPSPLRNNVLKNYLEGYDQDGVRYLLDGFSKVFSLGTVGEIPPVLAKNHSSVSQNSANFIEEKLSKEIRMG